MVAFPSQTNMFSRYYCVISLFTAYGVCVSVLNSISAAPVCQHHDNETLQATFITSSLSVSLKNKEAASQDFRRCSLLCIFMGHFWTSWNSVHRLKATNRVWSITLLHVTAWLRSHKCCQTFNKARPSTGAQRGQAGERQQNNYLSSFPPPLNRHSSLFYQNRKGLQIPELLCPADRWLIMAPAVV